MVNEPVAAGSGVRTAAGGDAELRLPGARIALAPASELQILRCDAAALEIALPAGRIGVHLDGGGAASTVEIDLPQGGVWLAAPGDYDITTGDAPTAATVQVFAGKARFGGGLDDSRIAFAAPDAFSDWWRSAGDNDAPTDARHGGETSGIAMLGLAGRWEHDGKLGDIWFPSGVAADWAPYRDGAWRYLAPWGWTWIDNAPWGFAPSHYGRWARLGDRWGWVPDAAFAAAYNPAAVAFIGTAGIGLSRPGDIGASPAVAWFPLAPGETVGDGNEANYANRRFAAAVPRAVFAAGGAIAPALVDDIPEQRFGDAPVILDGIGIAPVWPATAAPLRQPDIVSTAAAIRQPFIVALRDAASWPAPRERRKRANAALSMRSPAASTRAFYSAHNRQHLAARGGV